MEGTPFFSVIIPTYNRSKSIKSAINSILNQSFQDFEVVVVDDGSTDNTRDVVSLLMENDNRIRYFYKENEERSIARNYGISNARGKYVNFLDSDDMAYPQHLELGYLLLRKNNFPEVGHMGFELIDPSGNKLVVRNEFDHTFKIKLIHDNILHGNAILIRQDVVRVINFIPSPYAILAEDWYLWLRLASRYVFHFDNSVTVAIIQHEHRSLMKIDPDKLIRNTEVIIEYLETDKSFLSYYKGSINYFYSNLYTFVTLILALTKRRRRDTIKYLLVALKYDFTVVFRRRFLASLKHLF